MPLNPANSLLERFQTAKARRKFFNKFRGGLASGLSSTYRSSRHAKHPLLRSDAAVARYARRLLRSGTSPNRLSRRLLALGKKDNRTSPSFQEPTKKQYRGIAAHVLGGHIRGAFMRRKYGGPN